MKKSILVFMVVGVAIGLGLLYLWRSGASIPGMSIFSTKETVPQPPELPE